MPLDNASKSVRLNGILQLWDFKVHLSVQHISGNNASFALLLFVEGRGLGLVLAGEGLRMGPVVLRWMSG